jgi:hypothetical protein
VNCKKGIFLCEKIVWQKKAILYLTTRELFDINTSSCEGVEEAVRESKRRKVKKKKKD